MRARALKLNIYSGRVGILSHMPAEKTLLRVMGYTFGILALLYLYILGNTVSNIVERRSHEAKIKTLTTEVAELELHFLALSGKIDPDYGRSLGFVESGQEHFATKKSVGSVSFNNNEL
jgi:hypothetical protein